MVGVVSFQRHPSPDAVVAEDGFVLREIVEETFDLFIVVRLDGVEHFTCWTLGT